jgi:DNA-binding transcriptional LysR family regulator
MNVTLDQARALDALARHGTLQKAAAALHKGHTALLYGLARLEDETGLTLLDRRGYRTKLTPAGERVLEQCRRLLAEERGLATVVDEIKTGFEPWVHVVLDGLLPIEPVLSAVAALRAEGAPTRLKVSVAFLGDVEATFLRDNADLMASVLPAETPGLRATKLPPVRARLVAHRDHPLARQRGPLSLEALHPHVLLTVRGSDPRLELSTSALERQASVHLADFGSKKAAILQGIGYGWLPEHLLAPELGRKILRALPLGRGATHTFQPRLYPREGARPGRAAQRLIDALTAG